VKTGSWLFGGGWGKNLLQATPPLVAVSLLIGFSGCFIDAEGTTVGPPPCNTQDDCPDPGPCAVRVCEDGFCVPDPVADGLAGTQIAGDCETDSCVAGELAIANDPSDEDDGRSCTEDACEPTGAVHDPLPEGSECAIGTVMGVCSADGDCLVECSESSPCPLADPCLSGECVEQICVYTPVSGDPVVAVRDPDGDCKEPTCLAGSLGQKPDGVDLPPDDGLPCTNGICNGDQPEQDNLAAGSPCGVELVCDGAGVCDGCTTNTQCGAPVECTTPTCNSLFQCEDVFAAPHTPCGGGVCKAGGSCVQCVDATDCPAQTECTYSTCDSDACVPQTVPAGSACLLTPANRCNAAGQCVECLSPADCPLPTACESHVCTLNVCTPVPVAPNSACLVGAGFCDATGACAECTLPIHCPVNPEICCMGTCQTPPCP